MRSNKSIHYWRKGFYEGLEDLAKVFSVNPIYSLFVEFASYREKGLRKQALIKLSEFIDLLSSEDFSKRKAFVSLFCDTSLKWKGDSYLFSPHPLVEKIIRPTTLEWIKKEPENALAYRWAGVYSSQGFEEAEELFQHAIRLDPSDEYSRGMIVNILLNEPDHSVHHLNESIYLGDPEKDLDSLKKASLHVKKLTTPKLLDYWTKEIEEYKVLIDNWIEYSIEKRNISYPQFLKDEKGLSYVGLTTVYYDK